MSKLNLHELLKQFKEEDYLTVKSTAVQYLINSGRMDADASAAAWCLAVTDRLVYVQNKIDEAKSNISNDGYEDDEFEPR